MGQAVAGSTRAGRTLADLEEVVAALMAGFAIAGAERVDPAILQPAETLLDLYGEDIRARAFMTSDGALEMMLRPDLTVPVLVRHLDRLRRTGATGPARYAYAGPVWRRQPAGSTRAAEYLQAGIELLGGRDPAAADAEVFALVHSALAGHDLRVATGDMSLLFAAIDGLKTSAPRRAALRRHVWRPARFQRLLARFSQAEHPKAALIAATKADPEAAVAAAGRALGRRSAEEVVARLKRLAEDADVPPLAEAEGALIEALLKIAGPADRALHALEDLAGETPTLAAAVARYKARLDALDARGIDPGALSFEGSFGRTTLEYYDGFVFGFYAPDRPDLPVIASGGRYDALTGALNGGVALPAVGAIVRPEALVELGPR